MYRHFEHPYQVKSLGFRVIPSSALGEDEGVQGLLFAGFPDSSVCMEALLDSPQKDCIFHG